MIPVSDQQQSSHTSRSSVQPNDGTSCSLSIPQDISTFCVDPRLTSFPAESALSAMIAEERQNQVEKVIAIAARDVRPEEIVLPSNDFDKLLAETPTPIAPPPLTIDQGSIGWLDQWLKQNPSRMPSSTELQCLEGLTKIPGSFILEFLTQRTLNLLKQQIITEPSISSGHPPKTQTTVPDSPPQPNLFRSTSPPPSPCSAQPAHQSSSSHHHKHLHTQRHSSKHKAKLSSSSSSSTSPSLPNPKPYHCTTFPTCHRTFTRPSDRTRHERSHIEEWLCPLTSCGATLTRKEKLRDHLRGMHLGKEMSRRELEGCRRVKRGGGGGGGGEEGCGICFLGGERGGKEGGIGKINPSIPQRDVI